jgi:MFS family permease
MLFYFCVILIIEQKIMVCDWGCAMNQKERYFQILLLILAAGSIYTLPYIRTNFQSVLLVAFDMSLEELSILYTLIGFLFIIGYIPSGWLADKFSIKYLIVISLVITACCGFYMATIPVKEHLYVIFLIWGISCVFTFWASLIKGITILSTSEEKPFVFGFLDGGRGLVEALLATMVFFIFKSVVNDSTSVDVLSRGLSYVLSFYSLFILIIAVLILRFMNNLEEKGKVVDCGIDDVVGVFKRVDILLLCFIIFGGYTLFWTSYYMGGFIEIKLSIPTTGIVGIVTLMLWMRPLAGFTCGLVAAKLGTSKTLVFLHY